MRSYLIIFLLFFLFFTLANAQLERSIEIQDIRIHYKIPKENNALKLNSTSLDSYITSRMSRYHIPGLSACILKDDSLIWHNSYGYIDIENEIPVTDSTLFLLASISKTITGTAIMQLYERGLFDLDDNVNNFLPPNLQIINPSYPDEEITFRMILSHVSSFKDNSTILDTLWSPRDYQMSLYNFLKNYFLPEGIYYSDDSFDSIPPGNSFNYSNFGVTLLGYLVEVFTDTSFEDYCQSHIFMPLGMNETSWFLANLDTNHIARPYQWTSSGYEPFSHYGFPDYPDGQLRTSSIQLARFLNAFMHKGKLDNIKILDSTTVDLITTIHYPEIPLGNDWPDSSQGLIWYWDTIRGKLVWGHTGGFYGSSTAMFFSKHEKTGVIVLTNGSADQDPQPFAGVWEITDRLFDYAVTRIDRYDKNIIKHYILDQNYPNPFNPVTVISWHLPISSNVDLSIYNILGQKICTLVLEKQKAGHHQIEWDASKVSSAQVFTINGLKRKSIVM